MANAWKEVAWIAAEAVNYMQDALTVTRLAAKDKTAEFNTTANGYAKGAEVDIRTNPVYETKEFTSTIATQDIRSSSRKLKIEKHFDISVAMTAKEKRLDFEDFSTQIIKPAAYSMAEKMDSYVASKILNAQGIYASANLFTTAADMALAKKAATFQQLSPTGRFCLVNDTLEAQLIGATFFGTYANRGDGGESVFREGSMGRAMGMDFYSSLQLPSHNPTFGTAVGVTNNAGNANLVGALSLTSTAITGTAKVGDHLLIAGVRRPLVVGTQVTAGATSIPLAHPITDIIPTGAAITVIGSGATGNFMGAIFDDSSLAFAAPMLDPASDKPSSVVSDNGYSMRVVQGYDLASKTETISIDALCGAEVWDPRRITLLYDI
jgi:hypothetical protein